MNVEYLAKSCPHRVGGDPWHCNACRFDAMRAEQDAKRAEYEERARALAEYEAAERARSDAWVAYMEEHYGHLTRRQWVRISNDGSDPIAHQLNQRTPA